MKSLSNFEDVILDSSEIMKKAGKAVVYNMGKIIALFVSVLMIAITFTDITFAGIFTKDFACSLALLIISSYIIYFSLEDAGEKCGEETEEFKRSKEKYDLLRKKISGSDIEPLRAFCGSYSEKELEFRKKNALLTRGISENMFNEYRKGKIFDKKTMNTLSKIEKIKPVILTPKILLCGERPSYRSEIENPEKRKIISLILKLIPSTICMTVTLSVILTAKDGLNATDVLNSMLKLSALPLIGFKGYSAGYSYVKHSLAAYTETKANIIEDFLLEKQNNVY